jgi:hypothetical protein
MLKRLIAAAAALAVTASAAEATIVMTRINATGQTVPSGITNIQIVPGLPATSFTVLTAGTYMVTFTAECAVGGTGNLMNIGIVVDGTYRAPTGLPGGLAFCSSNQTPGIDGWESNTARVPVFLAVGNHTLQIRTQLTVPGTTGWLDDFVTDVQN